MIDAGIVGILYLRVEKRWKILGENAHRRHSAILAG